MDTRSYLNDTDRFQANIRVIGVGGGGCAALNYMVDKNIEAVRFIAIDTDMQSLATCKAPVKILIGGRLTRGLGTGADPGVGRKAAQEDIDKIREHLKGADMIFIICGLGGGTGTGASTVISEIAKELSALTVAIATKPFAFEGKDRMAQAEHGVTELKTRVDSLIKIPNQRLLSIGERHMTITQAFLRADEVLLNAVRSISDLIVGSRHAVVDFADIKMIMSKSGMAIIGIGESSGKSSAREAAQKAISNPILEDISIYGARGVLINITGNHGVTSDKIYEACSLIQEQAHENAKIIWCFFCDDSMEDSMRITVIATGFEVMLDPLSA
jgi:cell division protein FtsZ